MDKIYYIEIIKNNKIYQNYKNLYLELKLISGLFAIVKGLKNDGLNQTYVLFENLILIEFDLYEKRFLIRIIPATYTVKKWR